jgi:hypothetical protein
LVAASSGRYWRPDWTLRPKRDIMREARAADGRRYSVAVRGRYRIVDAECLNVLRAEQEEAP